MFGLWENGDEFDQVSARPRGRRSHSLSPFPSLSPRLVAVPQHRRLLYDLFTRNYRVKRSAVQARLAQEFGDVSKAEVDRLFQVREEPSVQLAPACSPQVVMVPVTPGVLQQLRRDVVPEGNHPVLTGTARLPQRLRLRCPAGAQSGDRQPRS